MLECVLNISEGRDDGHLAALVDAAADDLLDVHTDPHHHRTVLTVVGVRAPRAVAAVAVERLDLRDHVGAHPRLGVVDVVPFVALEGSAPDDALEARDAFAVWLADTLAVPGFLYGPDRSLPEVRRDAFGRLEPDTGPRRPHPTAGATAVGARPVLVAYNVWLEAPDVDLARRVAAALRRPELRALGLTVGPRVQVSMNLVDPHRLGPAAAFDLVAEAVGEAGGAVAGAELVGLIPAAVLTAVDEHRWAQLDLSRSQTIEARLARRG